MDKNLAWMHLMLKKSKGKDLSITRDAFNKLGTGVKLFPGVKNGFNQVNQYGEERGVEVRHYVISSGLKEIIEGSSIKDNFTRIYASTFLYNVDGIAEWPAQVVNYTNKTQFIFRIAKGCLEEYDDSVNDSTPDEKLEVPYENFIYIGDSDTDIPCMRVVSGKGGHAIGVYDPETDKRSKVYQLYADGRIDFFAAADYRKNGDLYRIVKMIIDEIAVKETMKTKKRGLKSLSNPYKLYKDFKTMLGDNISEEEQKLLNILREEIKGNID